MEGEKKIYFIYANIGELNNIKKFIPDKKIKKIKEIDKNINKGNIQILYCVEISANNNEEEVKISLTDNKNKNYFANIPLNTLKLLGEENVDTDEFVIFEIKFQNKEENNLKQIILPPNEQFYIFEKYFKNNDDNLINLYSSAITQIFLKSNQKFDLILYIFLKIFDQNKCQDIPRFKEVLKYFFQNIDKILIKAEYTPELNIEKVKLDMLSDFESIRKKMIKLSGSKEENIDLFLAYYYIYYKKKLFIKFINSDSINITNKYEIKNVLKAHRKIFRDFTIEIINSDLIDEAEDVKELVSLMELYPNIVECFKVLTIKNIYDKFTNFKLMFKRSFNPMLVFKPSINDDIYLLKDLFDKVYNYFLSENIYPIIIKENFFVEYYKCFEEKDEDFDKNLLIIDMLTLYNTKALRKLNTKEILESHFKKGITLLKNKKLKNETFMKFIKQFQDMTYNEELIKYFPDGIEFIDNNDNNDNKNNNGNYKFNEDILIEDRYDLKYFLGDNYTSVFQRIFDKFVKPKDLSVLRHLKIDDRTPILIIKLFMITIKRVWLNDSKNPMYGMETLFSSIFSRASVYYNDYMKIIKDIENAVVPENLMMIYSNILLKKYEIKDEFKEHIIDYIKKYKKDTALYLWFEVCTCIDKSRGNELLKNKLKKEFAVKYNDFVDYPKKANGRIILFTRLLKNNYKPENFEDSEYYKCSLESKNNLEKNIYKDAVTMYFNLQKILDLLIDYFVKEDKKETERSDLEGKIINIQKKIEYAKTYSEDLKTIEEYWETFFPNENKDKLDKLRKQIDKFENTKLDEIENEVNLNKETLNHLEEAKEGKNFINSIFFMGIYDRYKKDKETIGYKLSIKLFQNLEKIGVNNNLNTLTDNFKKIIINVADENENLLEGELKFIEKYFKFSENNKYKNFNINTIKKNIQNLVKINRKGRKPEKSIITKINTQKKEKEIANKTLIIKRLENKIPEMKKKLEIKSLFDQLKYNLNIFEKSNSEEVYNLFFKFYIELYNIGEDLSKLTSEEINDDIINLANKIFYLGKNCGIIDNEEIKRYKEDILWLHEYNYMIKKVENFKGEKKNYVKTFASFQKLYNNYKNNEIDVGGIVNLLDDVFKNIIHKYEEVNIYIEIFLTNLKMKTKKNELLNYILGEGNSKFYKDLFPIFDEIFSGEIENKFKFRETKSEHYYGFLSEDFKEDNDDHVKNVDDLQEMLFYYFETKIMKVLKEKQNNYQNNNQNNNQNYLESIAVKKDKNFISLIFIIAFVKCYIYIIIKIIQENPNVFDPEYFFGGVLRFKEKNSDLSPFRASVKLYILKLIMYYNGNISDIKNLSLNRYCLDSLENNLVSNFGFDFILIPLQLNTSDEAYKSILEQFFKNQNIFKNDEIIEKINNNIDILFCLFVNFDFSHYYNSNNYFETKEHQNIEEYFSSIKDKVFKDNKIIEKLFLYFFNLKGKNVYKEFRLFKYEQILSLLISTRFIINIISSKDEESLFYNLLVNTKETLNKYPKIFNEYYLKDFGKEDFNSEFYDNRNINCLTYKIINYIILSHIYFAFILNLINYEDVKNIIALKETDAKNSKNVSDYLLEQIFKEFDFIKRKLLPLLGINNIIIFMNSIFKEIYQILINFKCGDDDEKIKKNEESIESAVNNVIKDYSKSVKEYYKIEKSLVIENNDINNNVDNKNDIYDIYDIYDIISEKSEYYNDKEKIDKYPLLSYFTYSNYSVLNDDFKNQYIYFNYDNSEYPLISSVLCEDKIFKIIEVFPNIIGFVNHVHDELNMRYTEKEINEKTIKDTCNDKLKYEITNFNNIIEVNNTLFDQYKKIDVNQKLFEIINTPGSTINYVVMKIIEIYNTFLTKMKNANINIFDEVIIQEAKKNDYNINCIKKNGKELTIKQKLDELILLYSKRERKRKNEKGIFEINVYNGGKIIYDFSIIEKKLEEQFIFGKKIFSEEQREFIFSDEIFKQENNIIKEFKIKYPLNKITNDNKNKLMEYLNNINEERATNIFYELFFAFKYIIEKVPDLKFKNLKDLIKYLELRNYKLKELNNAINAINQLKENLSIDTILHFYEMVLNKAFNYLTKDIEKKLKNKKIYIEENITNNIDSYFDENNIIKMDTITSAMKKFILRNIMNDDSNNYLFNLEDLRKEEDLWDITIFRSKEFKDNFDKLVELNKNENYVVNYLYVKIYEIEIEEEEEEDDE